MVSQNNKCKHNRTCCCSNSDECSKLRELFALANDIRGADPVSLDLSGSSSSKLAWKDAVAVNLKNGLNDISNIKRLPVIRHHWSVKQLKYFYTEPNNRKLLTPMLFSKITKIAHVID